jgi:hypothetical protein
MYNIDVLSDNQKLLLMAAAVNKLGPDIELRYANSAVIVSQAIIWANLWSKEIDLAWNRFEYHPVIRSVYGALIQMIQDQPASDVFFKGAGNFGTSENPASFPHFTSCSLTQLGMEVAEQLLKNRPELVKSE